MRLNSFRVQMYKSILDSGWVDVSELTVVVGKNESGKTSLLRALHKLNPFKPDPYLIHREWPRGRRREQDDRQVVCTTRFTLDPAESAELSSIAGHTLSESEVTVSRDYGGRLEVTFPEGLFPDSLHPNEVDAASESLPAVPVVVSDEFKKAALACREEARRRAREGRYSELSNLAQEHSAVLNQNLTGAQPQRSHEDGFRNQYTAALQELARRLSSLPTIHAKAHEYVIKRVPTFIYMDDYRTFKGTARLDEVKARKDQGKSTEEDKTLTTIMELSGLELEKALQQGATSDREQRQYDLDDAGKTLTREIADRWQQKRYEVEFRADGPEFFTMVKDENDAGLIRLEERSKGFQWFFSFDLMFMYESRGSFQGCVLLLDEPGLHLHPDGQRDLLKRLAAYAGANQLIYTTHLPFMIDLRHPERIKVISESPKGAMVSDDLVGSQPEAKFTLQAALGMTGRTSYLVSEKNLVVEGVDDFWVVTELSNLLARSGLTGLPEDVFITAAGGASEAGYIATFMIGQQLDVAVLLDSDPAGGEAADRLVKRWLTKYKGKETQVLLLGDVVGAAGRAFAIEDLFPDEFYVSLVRDAYRKELAAAGAPEFSAQGDGLLCKRVERSLTGLGIKFNKGRVAKLLRIQLAKMKTVDELPPATKASAVKLIEAIRKALPST